MRRLPPVMLIPALLAGCASTQYVDDRTAATDGRIEALARQLSELGRSQTSGFANQDGRITRLGQDVSALGAGQEKLAARLAARELSDAERQGIMASLTARLNRQEERLHQGETAGRQALDLAADADKGLESLRLRMVDVERVQTGQQSALHAQRADMDQLLDRLQGHESIAAQAMAQAGWADTRGAVADNKAGQAATLAREAQDLARSLQARLEAMPVPPATGDAAARQLAEEAAAQAHRAIGLLDALQARVDALAQAVPAAVLPAVVNEHMTHSEQRLSRIEDSVTRHDQRLSGVVTGLEQAGARARRAEEHAAALAENDARLGLRLDKSEGLLARLQGQVQEALERQRGQEDALSQVSIMAREALERAMAAGQLAQGKFVYEVVLREDKFHFGLNSAELTLESMAALDDLVLRLNAQNADVFLEIQGHTDTSGPSEANLTLAQRRALAVRDYLKTKGHVPLHRMSVIALGDSRPAASNDTREGRQQNRRVVIEVLR